MKDAQRYRMNAAECLSAAEECELPYCALTLAIVESWLSPARQQQAMDKLLVIWSKANSQTSGLAAVFISRTNRPARTRKPPGCPRARGGPYNA
jgi:hypothetical protein